MSLTQQAVETYMQALRTKANEATTTFGADASEVTKHRDGRVTVTLFFVASAPSDASAPTPGSIKTAELSAADAAEQLRTFGASVQTHSEGAQSRVIAVFDAPQN